MPRATAITETAVCGFIDTAGRDSGTWSCVLQLPFRGSSLWLWGEPSAMLQRLRIGDDPHDAEQLMMPVPFSMFERPWASIATVQRLIEPFGPTPPQLELCNARCMPELLASPRIDLFTARIGDRVELEWTGRVQGLLLVGGQRRN